MANLFEKDIDVLSKSLDMYLTRQAVIADNIANAETPGYKARRVEFESQLQAAVEAQENPSFPPRDIGSISAKVYQDPESERGQDLNTVDMDREMAEMTKNELRYNAATSAISRKFSLLKYSISGGDK
jgi:flagellar basal-body rod protein FlgB